MTVTIYEHPFASYCWKPLIALRELEIPFERHQVNDEADRAALAELWPMAKIPVLVDDETGVMLPESTAIIEYADSLADSPRLIPADSGAALQARLWDRVFDNFVMNPMQKVVLDLLRPEDQRDAYGVEEARSGLRDAYAMLDAHLAENEWAAGEDLSLADCSAAPALFYAHALERIDAEATPHLWRYYEQLVSRPSVATTIEDARPFREFFPPGWPDYIK